jgi:TatD DNase family protein
MIDTHAHLNYPPLVGDTVGVLERMHGAGVERVIIPGTNLGTSESGVALAQEFAEVYAAVGIHPHDALTAQAADFDRLRALCLNPKVVAVGEIGLDYSEFGELDESEVSAQSAVQAAVFAEQLRVAEDAGKAVIIHSRDCFESLHAQLAAEKGALDRIVVHCFTGDTVQAEAWLALGCHLSFTGIITYKNAESIRAAAAIVPWERLMTETDAPFLAPVPFRGKTCEPAMVSYVAEQLAEIRHCSVEEVRERTTSTAEAFFQLP